MHGTRRRRGRPVIQPWVICVPTHAFGGAASPAWLSIQLESFTRIVGRGSPDPARVPTAGLPAFTPATSRLPVGPKPGTGDLRSRKRRGLETRAELESLACATRTQPGSGP